MRSWSGASPIVQPTDGALFQFASQPCLGLITWGRWETFRIPRHSALPVPGNGSRSSQRLGLLGRRPGWNQPMLPWSSATIVFSFQVTFAIAFAAPRTVSASLSCASPVRVSISWFQIAYLRANAVRFPARAWTGPCSVRQKRRLTSLWPETLNVSVRHCILRTLPL